MTKPKKLYKLTLDLPEKHEVRWVPLYEAIPMLDSGWVPWMLDGKVIEDDVERDLTKEEKTDIYDKVDDYSYNK